MSICTLLHRQETVAQRARGGGAGAQTSVQALIFSAQCLPAWASALEAAIISGLLWVLGKDARCE